MKSRGGRILDSSRTSQLLQIRTSTPTSSNLSLDMTSNGYVYSSCGPTVLSNSEYVTPSRMDFMRVSNYSSEITICGFRLALHSTIESQYNLTHFYLVSMLQYCLCTNNAASLLDRKTTVATLTIDRKFQQTARFLAKKSKFPFDLSIVPFTQFIHTLPTRVICSVTQIQGDWFSTN
jgi:hypothetical protein